MRRDLPLRPLPFTVAVPGVWLLGGHPDWLGVRGGRLTVQLGFGLGAGVLLFGAAAGAQLLLVRVRGIFRVPTSAAKAAIQAGHYTLNAPIEEAFFRGLLQAGLSVVLTPALGFLVGTATCALYHRLGGWAWADVLGTALAGVPLGLAFWLRPGPPSLLGVSVGHLGDTCGFIGPGPRLLRRLGLL